MTAPLRTLVPATLFAALAGPASADLTAQQLWQLWQDQGAEQGRTVTAKTAPRGDGGLDLTDLRVTQSTADGPVVVRLERMALVPSGSEVEARVAADQRFEITFPDGAGPSDRVAMDITRSDLALTASGTAPRPDYALSADALELTLAEVMEAGRALDATGSLLLEGLAGALSGPAADTGALAADLSAASMAVSLAYTDPQTGAEVATEARQADLSATGRIAPVDGTAAPPEFRSSAELRSGPSETISRVADPVNGRLETENRHEATVFSVDRDPGRAEYGLDVTGLSLRMRGDRLPVPEARIDAASAGIALDMPTQPGDTPQTGALRLEMTEVTAGDALWGMIDPSGALPRSPASLRLDAQADVMLRDEVEGEGADTPPPGFGEVLPQSVRVETLNIGFAEAELGASGAFTFETGPEGLPDPSRPIGQMDLQASGVQALLDQLVQAGLIGPDQIMGVQMMIGMFATPGPEGTLTSTIEAQSGGAVYVNGNRVR